MMVPFIAPMQLVSITKEMCALRGAAKTDFNTSVASFIQEITYISKLIGKANDTLHAMALTSHLLAEAVPSDIAEGQLQVGLVTLNSPMCVYHYMVVLLFSKLFYLFTLSPLPPPSLPPPSPSLPPPPSLPPSLPPPLPLPSPYASPIPASRDLVVCPAF